MTKTPPLDARMRRAIVGVAATGAVFALLAAAFVDLRTALSVAIGAALATGNLWGLARLISAMLPGEDGGDAPNRAAWALFAILKMFALFGAVWLLMRHGVASPIPMLVGFGSLPIGIAIGSLVSDRSAPESDDDRP